MESSHGLGYGYIHWRCAYHKNHDPDPPFKLSLETSSPSPVSNKILLENTPATPKGIIPVFDISAIESIIAALGKKFNLPIELTLSILEYTGGFSLLHSSALPLPFPRRPINPYSPSPKLYQHPSPRRPRNNPLAPAPSRLPKFPTISIPLLHPLICNFSFFPKEKWRNKVMIAGPRWDLERDAEVLGIRDEEGLRVGCLGVGIEMEVFHGDNGRDRKERTISEQEGEGKGLENDLTFDSGSDNTVREKDRASIVSCIRRRSPRSHNLPRFSPYPTRTEATAKNVPPLRLTLLINWRHTLPLALSPSRLPSLTKRNTHFWYLRRGESKEVDEILDEVKVWKQVSLRVEGVRRGGGVRVWRGEVGVFGC